MEHNRYLALARESFVSKISPCTDPEDTNAWTRFGFYVTYNLYRMVRANRYRIGSITEVLKPDGSPVTQLEMDMEAFAISSMRNFCSEATFVGEESGGEAADHKYLFVLDPIDGTRNFLSGFESYCITLAVLIDKRPVFSAVCAPSTGDMYFRVKDENSLAIRISRGTNEPEIRSIPFFSASESKPILVNLHPSLHARKYFDELFGMWESGEIALLKSVSGSPSLMMVEAAKTGTFYLNVWDEGPTKPFDLIPGLHILEGAHCVALQKNGHPIDAWSHKGLYVVGPPGKRLDLLLSRISTIE